MAQNYTFTPVTIPGGAATVAPDGINDSGEIVGSYTDSSGVTHGFEDVNGQVTAVGVAGATLNAALGVNAGGTIVGEYVDSSGKTHGFTEANGTATTFDFVTPSGTVASGTALTGINSSGEMVGTYTDATGSHGFIDVNGTDTSIDIAGGTNTQVHGVNDSGEYVGQYTDANNVTHGFEDINGTEETFDIPGAKATYLEGVNDAGDVSGYYTAADGTTHGFVTTNPGGANSTTSILDTPGAASTAYGLNDADQVGVTGSDQQGYIASPVCFASGTRIRTVRGDVAVEELRVGDRAVTASGAARPITWLGHRSIDCAAQAMPSQVWPVRVLAGAFGGGLPARDLYLSPGHPVLVGADADEDGGHLVPVMCLVNGTTIDRVPMASVTYWHVELDAHDILLAEGLPAESYLDWGDRDFFSEADSHALANPDFVVPGLGRRCRPVAVDGPVVEAARRRLDIAFAGRLATACSWPRDEAALLA